MRVRDRKLERLANLKGVRFPQAAAGMVWPSSRRLTALDPRHRRYRHLPARLGCAVTNRCPRSTEENLRRSAMSFNTRMPLEHIWRPKRIQYKALQGFRLKSLVIVSDPAKSEPGEGALRRITYAVCFRLQNSSPGPSLHRRDLMTKGPLTRPLVFLTGLCGPERGLIQ